MSFNFGCRSFSCLGLIALVTGQACVDDEVLGQSARLLVLESPNTAVPPGTSVHVTFQATDDVGGGVPDQRLEVLLSDPTRLNFIDEPGASRVVVLTGRHVDTQGVTLEGGAVVKLRIPDSAVPGSVTVIGSLEGNRGPSSKTRWVEIMIGESTGMGGAGGLSGAGGEPVGGYGGEPVSGAGGEPVGGAGGDGTGGATGEGGLEQRGEAGEAMGGVGTAGGGHGSSGVAGQEG